MVLTIVASNSGNGDVFYLASTHACHRLSERIPHLAHADIPRLQRILVALCFQGRRVPVTPWVIGQYYLEATEHRSGSDLILAMQSLPERPGTSVVRTVLWPDEFALRNRPA